MPTLYLPDSYRLAETRKRHSNEIAACVVLDREWTRLLKDVDDKLYMVRSKHWVKTGLPLIPGGCWHIVRDNSDRGAPETIIPLFEKGVMLEPGSWVFEMLRRNDLQRPGALQERQRTEQRLEASKERQRKREREDRQQAIHERWQAGTRAFIGWTPEGKWTQSAKAKREKK